MSNIRDHKIDSRKKRKVFKERFAKRYRFSLRELNDLSREFCRPFRMEVLGPLAISERKEK